MIARSTSLTAGFKRLSASLHVKIIVDNLLTRDRQVSNAFRHHCM